MKPHPINILIIDDQKCHNSSISKALDDNPNINVVGVATNDQEMYNVLKNRIVNLVLLDVELPKATSKDGIQISRELRRSNTFRNIGILCLSMNTQSHVLRTLLVDICVDGYLDKNEVEIEDIAQAIKDVIKKRNLPILSLGLRKKVQRIMSDRTIDSGISTLTKRERHIISYIAEGLTNSQISKTLSINEGKSLSEKTVGKHRENVYQKLDCNNATQVAKIYFDFIHLHSDDHDQKPHFKTGLI